MTNRKYYLDIPDDVYDQFEQLLDDYNVACEAQDQDMIEHASFALHEFGAGVDMENQLWIPPGAEKADPLLFA